MKVRKNTVLMYGSPGYPWKTRVHSIEKENGLVFLNCIDTNGKDETLTFSEHTFNILEKYGAVHFTSVSGGYVHTYLGERAKDYTFADEKIKAKILNNPPYGYDDLRKYINK